MINRQCFRNQSLDQYIGRSWWNIPGARPASGQIVQIPPPSYQRPWTSWSPSRRFFPEALPPWCQHRCFPAPHLQQKPFLGPAIVFRLTHLNANIEAPLREAFSPRLFHLGASIKPLIKFPFKGSFISAPTLRSSFCRTCVILPAAGAWSTRQDNLV